MRDLRRVEKAVKEHFFKSGIFALMMAAIASPPGMRLWGVVY